MPSNKFNHSWAMIRVTSILLLVFISTKVSSIPQAPGPNDGGEAVGQALKGLLDENNLDERWICVKNISNQAYGRTS